MMSRFLAIVLLLSSQIFGFVGAAQTRGSGFRTRENNVHAPQLYADKLDFMATLVDLPGAKNKQSYWELSYQLYFVPEETYWATVRRLPRNGQAMDYFSRENTDRRGISEKDACRHIGKPDDCVDWTAVQAKSSRCTADKIRRSDNELRRENL
jgi:hypothetical protein